MSLNDSQSSKDREHAEIIRAIKTRTGREISSIAQLDGRDAATARDVLPILVEYHDQIRNVDLRRALVSRFHTPLALPYLRNLAAWLLDETESHCIDYLFQDIGLIAKPDDGVWLWPLMRAIPSPFPRYGFAVALAKSRDVGHEVRDRIFQDLQSCKLRSDQLLDIAKIEDVRIREWFREQLTHQIQM